MAFPGNKLKGLYNEGINCRNAGQLDTAKKCFKEILQHDSMYTAAYLQLAEIYALEEEFSESIRYYQHFLRLDGRQPASWYAIGVLYFNKKDFHSAVTAFERANGEGHPADADYYLNLGTACLHISQVEKGLKHLKSSLSLRQRDTRPMQALAHHYYLSGNFESAISYWNKLLREQPENAFALFMLGKSYIGKGDVAKGEQMCDRALAVTQ
jgi:tetratricopeptide (TPR) repeat protein